MHICIVNGNTSNINLLLHNITNDIVEFDLVQLFENKLNETNLTKTALSKLLNIDLRNLNEILEKRGNPSVINILKLAYFLEIDNLNEILPSILQGSVENIRDIETTKYATILSKHFDIKKLHSIGFFDNIDNTQTLVTRIVNYFGYDSLYDYTNKLADPLLSKTKVKFTDKMLKFWVQSAYRSFETISNPNDYNREALKDIITKIRPYTKDVENGLFVVCKAMYSVGVTVIVQSHLTTTQVRGGTFVVKGKPCIVLTDLNKRYTTIWETLIHELHHVLHDLDTIGNNGYHLSGNEDIFLIEENAEYFAREFFCGEEDYQQIKLHINNPFMVERFAKQLEIDKSFIYSSFRQFQKIYHGRNFYSAYNEFFPKINDTIKKLKPITWKEQSLTDVALEIKSIFELETIKEYE